MTSALWVNSTQSGNSPAWLLWGISFSFLCSRNIHKTNIPTIPFLLLLLYEITPKNICTSLYECFSPELLCFSSYTHKVVLTHGTAPFSHLSLPFTLWALKCHPHSDMWLLPYNAISYYINLLWKISPQVTAVELEAGHVDHRSTIVFNIITSGHVRFLCLLMHFLIYLFIYLQQSDLVAMLAQKHFQMN